MSSFLVVSVTISELLIGVLPLTSWQPLMEKAGGLSNTRLRDELGDLAAGRPLRNREGWDVQDVGRFRWLLARLRDVYGEELSPTLLHSILGEASRYARVSELSPIRTVGVNREVRPAVLESRVTVKADAAERVFEVDASEITWAVVDSGVDRQNIAFTNEDGESRVIRSFDVPRVVNAMRQEDPTTFAGLVVDSTWETFAKPRKPRPPLGVAARRLVPWSTLSCSTTAPTSRASSPRTNDRMRRALGPPSSACARRCDSSTSGSSTKRGVARSSGSSWRCDSSGG